MMLVTRLVFDLATWVGWATILATVVTAVGVIVAVVTLVNQSKQARFGATIDSLWRFDDQLHGTDMRRIRLAAARGLQQGHDVPEIVDVLNFFEMLGFVFRKGGMYKDAALNNFGYWVIGYWYACHDHVAKDQRDDPSAWEEYEGLKTTLEKMDREKKRRTGGTTLVANPGAPDAIRAFLDNESKLKV